MVGVGVVVAVIMVEIVCGNSRVDALCIAKSPSISYSNLINRSTS